MGSRLGDRVRAVPKPLLEVAGEPFASHQIRLLAAHGFERVVLCVGYLGEQFEAALGGGGALGVHIEYAYDPPGLAGTAGAIRGALDALGDEFVVLYGDTYLRVDYGAAVAARRASGQPALMAVLRNAGRWDTSNVAYADGAVLAHDKRRPADRMEWIDYGVGVLTRAALETTDPAHTDLSDVYAELAARGALAGYEASERFYEIGTPASLEEADAFLGGGGAAAALREARSARAASSPSRTE